MYLDVRRFNSAGSPYACDAKERVGGFAIHRLEDKNVGLEWEQIG